MYAAFQYASSNPLETEADYPYKAHDETCEYNKEKGQVKTDGLSKVPSGSVE
jgi:hypothetical protein